jgi:hypothetical protein
MWQRCTSCGLLLARTNTATSSTHRYVHCCATGHAIPSRACLSKAQAVSVWHEPGAGACETTSITSSARVLGAASCAASSGQRLAARLSKTAQRHGNACVSCCIECIVVLGSDVLCCFELGFVVIYVYIYIHIPRTTRLCIT